MLITMTTPQPFLFFKQYHGWGRKKKSTRHLSNFAWAHISPPGRSIFCPTSSGLKRWDSALSPLSSLGNEWEMLCEKGVIWEGIRCDISALKPCCLSLSLPRSCHPWTLLWHINLLDYYKHVQCSFHLVWWKFLPDRQPLNSPKGEKLCILCFFIHLIVVFLSLIIKWKAYSIQNPPCHWIKYSG